MLRNKGFQMIVGAIVITGVIIAWLMLGGEAPSNNPVQKESSGANAKVRNSTLAREVDGKKVWEFTVEEVEQIQVLGIAEGRQHTAQVGGAVLQDKDIGGQLFLSRLL